MRELLPSSDRVFGGLLGGLLLLLGAVAVDWLRQSMGLSGWVTVVLALVLAPFALRALQTGADEQER